VRREHRSEGEIDNKVKGRGILKELLLYVPNKEQCFDK
jgi:hypothetical protein